MLDVLDQVVQQLPPFLEAQQGSRRLAAQTVVGSVEPSVRVEHDLRDLEEQRIPIVGCLSACPFSHPDIA
jgi:hypothetical protein